jgi:hypothetical protein
MAFKLPKTIQKISPLSLTDPKIKPFQDPGAPEGFEKGLYSGSTEVIGTPYEGRAFTGRSGSGKSFKPGKKVPDWSTTEDFGGTKWERDLRLSGETKVTENQPKYLDKPGSQRRNVKGSTVEVKKYEFKRVGAKKSPANMVPNYKFTGLKDKVKQNAARNRS